MPADPKMTPHTQNVLGVLIGRGADIPPGRRSAILADGLHGLGLVERTGLPNGTLYPILERLRQAGWVDRYWEEDSIAEAEHRPRRRYYRITRKGAELAPQALAEASAATSSSSRAGVQHPANGAV